MGGRRQEIEEMLTEVYIKTGCKNKMKKIK
jgi:hypothetical protein